jgi:hypothetical protein
LTRIQEQAGSSEDRRNRDCGAKARQKRDPLRSQNPVVSGCDLESKLGGRKVIHTV